MYINSCFFASNLSPFTLLASDALRLANCVLKRRPCQWTDCDFVAKNGSTLKDHVQEHATKKVSSCSNKSTTFNKGFKLINI